VRHYLKLPVNYDDVTDSRKQRQLDFKRLPAMTGDKHGGLNDKYNSVP